MSILVGFHHRNEKLLRNFDEKFFWVYALRLTEKCNTTLAKTQKGSEKLTEKRNAVFVFYFVGFHLKLTEKYNKTFGKDLSEKYTSDPTKPIFVVTLGLTYTSNIFAQDGNTAIILSNWVGLL